MLITQVTATIYHRWCRERCQGSYMLLRGSSKQPHEVNTQVSVWELGK